MAFNHPADEDDADELLARLGSLTAQARERAELHRARVELAMALQRDMLPRTLPAVPGLSVAARYVPACNGLNVGGRFSYLNTLEYQIPLTAKDNLFFVTFVDHGTVERSVEIRDYRVAVGFGFRISIPALGPVPVAFDFAFPLNKTDDDHRQIFAFYIGLFGGQ